jgi:hypothetical protein
MQDICRVNVLQSSADLVDEILEMRVGELLLRANNLVKVRFHKFLDNEPVTRTDNLALIKQSF